MISNLRLNEPLVLPTYGSRNLKTWYHFFSLFDQNFCSGDLKFLISSEVIMNADTLYVGPLSNFYVG